jgi:hypothetical protein
LCRGDGNRGQTGRLFQFIELPKCKKIFRLSPVFELLFVCILATLLWFELIVFLLPERWREKIGELQFGPAWAKRRDSRD